MGQEDPLKEGMATYSSILAWRIPWTEEPGGLQPVRSQRVTHDWNDLAGTQHSGIEIVVEGRSGKESSSLVRIRKDLWKY